MKNHDVPENQPFRERERLKNLCDALSEDALLDDGSSYVDTEEQLQIGASKDCDIRLVPIEVLRKLHQTLKKRGDALTVSADENPEDAREKSVETPGGKVTA